MDIYDYAMKLEKDGESYYRELEKRETNPGLKTILTMLADAEVEHYRIFERMKRNERVSVPESRIFIEVKNVFTEMKEKGEVITSDGREVELYRKAQDIEVLTRDFYREKAEEVEAGQRETLLKISEEEQRHYMILENVINFVNRPFEWLENAEWYHLEEY